MTPSNQNLKSSALLHGHLYFLFSCLLLCALPQAWSLPAWVSAVYVIGIVWRLYLVYAQKPLPNRWLLFLLAVLFCGGILAQFHSIVGKDAGVAFLVGLLAFKALETRSHRDAMVLMLLIYFVLLCNFLLSQSIFMGLYLLTLCGLVTANLIAWQRPTLEIRFCLQTSGKLLAQAIPLMLLLFFLFPRINGPLWRMPDTNKKSQTGLSDKLNPGSISELLQSEETAFRVAFEGTQPKQNVLYWRGPVLDAFADATWQVDEVRGIQTPSEIKTQSQTTPALRYTITMEPHEQQWGLALDMPISIPPDMRLSPRYQLVSAKPIDARIRYTVTSQTDYQINPSGLADADWQRNTYLSEEARKSNRRAVALGEQLRQQGGDARATSQKLLQLYNKQNFYYTLTPPTLGDNWIDGFLFNSKRGFCEHYAGSYVFVMRAAGVPARVVTGYQGGAYNPTTNYWIVKQSDAHAWAEIYLDKQGWVRVDPTAMVAPERVEQGSAAPFRESPDLPAGLQRGADWLNGLKLQWDAVQNGWNQWVLGYDSDAQSHILSSWSLKKTAWSIASIISLVLAYFLLRPLWLKWQRRRANPIGVLQEEYRRWLSTQGVVLESHQAILTASHLLMEKYPMHTSAIEDFTTTLLEARYGAAQRSAGGPDALRLKFTQLKTLLTPPPHTK